MNAMANKSDERPAAMLTPAQREYLRGERDEMSADAERALRSRIRERVKTGFMDFQLLWESWDEDEADQVFKDLFYTGEPDEQVDAAAAFADMFALCYSGLFVHEKFDSLFSRGIRQAEESFRGDPTDVVVSVAPREEFVETHDRETVERGIKKLAESPEGLTRLTDAEARGVIDVFIGGGGFPDLERKYRDEIYSDHSFDDDVEPTPGEES